MAKRVEIAGGGIGGLAAGLAFARRGWRVRVHEQDAELRILGAGIYIWENGLRVLETLGVHDRATEGAIRLTRRERRNADGTLFGLETLSGPGRLYVPLRRALLESLRDGLIAAGGEIVFGSRPAGADPAGRLLFADGSAAEADLVIGADGINSAIRASLGLLKSRRPVHQHAYRVMIPRLPEELASERGSAICEHWAGARRLLYAPCTRDAAYVQLTTLRGDTEANPFDRGFWSRLLPHAAWIIERIPEDGKSDWLELVRVHGWSKGRVALLGDAAAAQPPFLGQGGGMAMCTALALAHHVETAGDVMRGLAAWEAGERRFTEWVQTVSWAYGELARAPAGLRTVAFRIIAGSEWIKRRTLRAAVARAPTGAATPA
jgi:2-polyprenyl-6-methoxyphenol hydroxylase-like FAD-dependent oxidoreductase